MPEKTKFVNGLFPCLGSVRRRSDDADFGNYGATAPAVRTSPTSVAAARRIAPRRGAILGRVLEAIRAAGWRGLTDHEGQAETGILGDTWRPARVSLARQGVIAPAGTRETPSGRPANIWRAVG